MKKIAGDDERDGTTDKITTRCNEIDCGSLISLISCVRNDSNLNTQLFWNSLQRQLSFSAFLLVGLGLIVNALNLSLISCLSAFCISFIGALSSFLLLSAAKGNDLHALKYNESCEQLEKHLPDDIRNYAVMHTYKQRIQPNLESKIKPKMFILSWALFIFWGLILLSSAFCALAFSPKVNSIIELMTKTVNP